MVNRTFKVAGRLFHWKLQVYENGTFIKETDHIYRFKYFAQSDVDYFTKMEKIRQMEINLDY